MYLPSVCGDCVSMFTSGVPANGLLLSVVWLTCWRVKIA